MLRKIHGTNFFNRNFLGRISIKCQNGAVLPPALLFYFNGQALNRFRKVSLKILQNKLCRHRSPECCHLSVRLRGDKIGEFHPRLVRHTEHEAKHRLPSCFQTRLCKFNNKLIFSPIS
jgi:hypothetical protein